MAADDDEAAARGQLPSASFLLPSRAMVS